MPEVLLAHRCCHPNFQGSMHRNLVPAPSPSSPLVAAPLPPCAGLLLLRALLLVVKSLDLAFNSFVFQSFFQKNPTHAKNIRPLPYV